jgi:hypothetical protein
LSTYLQCGNNTLGRAAAAEEEERRGRAAAEEEERKGGSEGDAERRWKCTGVSKNTILILLITTHRFIFSAWQSSVY